MEEWLAQPNLVSNFRLAQSCPVTEVYQRVAGLTDEEYQLEIARSKAQTKRSPFANTLVKTNGQMSALRRMGRQNAEKRKSAAGIVLHHGVDATSLVYPRDLPGLLQKTGKTWCPATRGDVELPFAS